MKFSRHSIQLAWAVMLASAPAGAESLSSALVAAYDGNPEIGAQRALVRQSDEGVPQALSAGRPSVGVNASAAQAGIDGLKDNGRTLQAQLQLNQSIFQGGRVGLATSAAENRILAARARLRALENRITVDVVTAYADVLRYARVVDLNANQVKVLQRELQASRDRFQVGDLTRTDVAQSQARLSGAESNYIVARNQLTAARQAYLRVVGHLPDILEPMPALPRLPGTEGQAVDLAGVNNPSLIAARFDEAAARYDVKGIERARLPSLDAGVSAGYTRYYGNSQFNPIGGYFTQNAQLTGTIPLYQSGLIGSQVRQAQARRSQLQEQITVIARSVEESAVNSFATLQAARAIIESSKVAVDANALAAEGVKQENQVGTRTVLEVLNAEQEQLSAQVTLAAAQRDEQVAGYTLLAAVGGAEAEVLGVPATPYDATINARAVRRKIGDGYPADAPALPLPAAERASKSAVMGPTQP